jgi:FKBP-type peptidyl-prolyl cis-trans isomerase FkpA
MKRYTLYGILILLTLVSCNNQGERKSIVNRPDKNDLADINKYFVQKDRERIQNYIERKKIPMKESSSGLWYYIINEGNGKYFDKNDRISINYECSLLDGTECYNSLKTGPKELVLGKTEIEQGLYEGLRLLKSGGEAVFIIPPFLAYGLVGDGKSIPSRAVLVYHVKIRN